MEEDAQANKKMHQLKSEMDSLRLELIQMKQA